MNCITLFVDMAGQRSRSLAGSPRVTAAAVALPTADLPGIRERLPNGIKWKNITEPMAREVIGLLVRDSVAVAAATVNCDTEAWGKALADEQALHSQIASESHANAGWAKLPVVLAYELLSRACWLALAHFLRMNRAPKILDPHGLATIECSVVSDEEFSGEENVDTFKSFWNDEHIPVKKLAALGFRVRYPDVNLTTEQNEPLLLLPDVVAGLVHSAYLPDPGRVSMPLSHALSQQLLEHLGSLLAVDSFDFKTDYDRVFGEAMKEARARRGG